MYMMLTSQTPGRVNLNPAWLDQCMESSYLEAKLRLCCANEIVYSRAPVNRHNHFGHDGTYDPEATHIFDRNVPLFSTAVVKKGLKPSIWKAIRPCRK
ncbi:uncharacterized protein A4U43_C08F13570 [Asparagus officinalis]|nr:uncharacterized protein A4U43_C08F13570 [Asparagus officinalis]